MALTPAQQQTLKAYILTVPAWAALPNDSTSAVIIEAGLNSTASPEYVVWDWEADPQAIMQNGVVWADFKNLSAGQLAIWNLMTLKGYINAGKLNERLGLDEAFGKNSATNIGLQPHLKRAATVFQKLFAAGAGTTASPSTALIAGSIRWPEVQSARGA